MLDPNELRRAVDMQQRSDNLLQWIASAVKRGFVDFKTAHVYHFPASVRGVDAWPLPEHSIEREGSTAQLLHPIRSLAGP